MKYLDRPLPTPEANLACDEALLDWCEDGESDEILRVWEPAEHFVVLGYANCAAAEVNLEACRARQIPVLRRCSGGGTVLQGPGCLNYALVLRIQDRAELQTIAGTNAVVMNAHRDALAAALGRTVEIQGHTDLVIGHLKFSGNSQRRKRNFLLFHGAFLLNLDLTLVEELLRFPSRQPDYRRNRPHREFLRNLNVPATLVKDALRKTWTAQETSREPTGRADLHVSPTNSFVGGGQVRMEKEISPELLHPLTPTGGEGARRAREGEASRLRGADPVRLEQTVFHELPEAIIERLVAEKYSRSDWNLKF